MPTFTYVVRDHSGLLRRGEEETETEEQLIQALQRKGFFVVKVAPKRAWASANTEVELPEWLGGGGVSKKEVTVFTRQLGTLMRTGVNLVSAMEALEGQAKSAAMRRTIKHVREQVQTGMPVGDAFAEKERQFGELYINLVRAGDQTGTLGETMISLAEHMERSGKIAGRIKSALAYPVTVLLIGLGIGWYLLTQIVPQFAQMLLDMEAELPKLTEVTLAISNFLQEHPLEVGLGILALVVGIVASYRSERGKYIYHWVFERTPIVKLLFKGSSIASFASAFAVALRSGLPVLEALEIAERVVGNRVMRRAIGGIRADVSRGEAVSQSLQQYPVTFPHIFTAMLRAGEDSGNMEEMVENAQDYYQNEVDQTVDGLTSMLEPVMIVFLGGLIATIMLSMFLPMWGAMDAMGG